jgi:hypothetical protein
MSEINMDAIRQRVANVEDNADQCQRSPGQVSLSGYIAASIESSRDVPALIAEVERLNAKVERDHVELRDKRTDLLNVRGILSPNGYPSKVPMPLVPTVAPAVQWLVAEVERYQPVVDPSGEALYIHNHDGPGYRCGNTEWWNEAVHGPINDQGCDACESAPDGSWRPLYLRAGGVS